MKKKLPLFFALISLVLATLACSMNIGGPDYPESEIPISQQAVESMKSQFKNAIEAGATGNTVILTVTEAQITSLIALKLESQSDPFFTEPQVRLRNGKMTIYGKATQGYFWATVKIVVAVGVDEQGQPDIKIESADFGPFPVPSGFSNVFAATIEEAYTGAVGPVATGFRIEQIGIQDGFMVMAGKVK